jgi:hypothetical protein
MQLQISMLPTTDLDRRLANLEWYRVQAADAALQVIQARDNPLRDALATPDEVEANAIADLVAAAAVGERVYLNRVKEEAVADLYAAAVAYRAPTANVVKLIAKAPTKPTPRPCYMVTTEAGELLVLVTDRPLADGSAALMVAQGLPEDTLIALYYEGKGYPSHGPMKLGAAAAFGLQRQARYEKRAARAAEKAAA